MNITQSQLNELYEENKRLKLVEDEYSEIRKIINTANFSKEWSYDYIVKYLIISMRSYNNISETNQNISEINKIILQEYYLLYKENIKNINKNNALQKKYYDLLLEINNLNLKSTNIETVPLSELKDELNKLEDDIISIHIYNTKYKLNNNLPQGLSSDLPQELSKDLPQELSKDLPQGLSGNLPQELSKDLPQGLSGNLPQGLSSDVPINKKYVLIKNNPIHNLNKIKTIINQLYKNNPKEHLTKIKNFRNSINTVFCEYLSENLSELCNDLNIII